LVTRDSWLARAPKLLRGPDKIGFWSGKSWGTPRLFLKRVWNRLIAQEL